ncbi:ATP-dependent RNA helicase HrpA [Enemella evansiae]|uniref:ATP-dependent RNA helicase HrpA n=1 Tax=Enemella evansiae TaxID=2016499 RepID=UPI000B973887|nr:ATP-dependent RNA helicase HrpA [Enemella evansiae]OYN98062.1 ATP-dependent RNA helicase HrpA [Enemella evansiae]
MWPAVRSHPDRGSASLAHRHPDTRDLTAVGVAEAGYRGRVQITFDEALPITERVDDIAAAIRDNQVVVVAGETGSGKTTQLPKIALQQGLTRIAHTQPRRIAARSVAERVAEELHVELGQEVGYQVRFTRRARTDSPLVLMTDGVLLAEIAHDRDLRRHDCIIIDEAHERSLNIDFLLGYLKQLLPRRPELKVIITSATIDTARFAAHFDDAPIIEVSGRTYPVEIRNRPLQPEPEDPEAPRPEPRDQVDAICEAVTELSTEGLGDILIFLSGEREIRDTADALAAMKLPNTEIVPLYARLSAAEQHKVFTPHTGRRIVLATNVAETSLTVPGIRYVIDPGTARISRWSARTKVQRLPIEPISQASANQRAGRCGRVAPGICIRLYSSEDYLARPEFTEPEILRTNLASVILQMAQAELGDIADFGFVEPPEAGQITDGVRLLVELGALTDAKKSRQHKENGPRLTRIGQQLARIPVDPRMARMLVEAARRDCLSEVLVIVAGLTINDPRERPAEHQQAADELHRRFWSAPVADGADRILDGSDFIAWLRLWDHLAERREALSGNAFRRMCRDEFLHYLRIREWQDLVSQLRQVCRELKLERNATPAKPEAIHTAILSGLLSQIGLADLKAEKKSQPRQGRRRRPGPREYLGTRGSKFAINPGSSVARSQPELVMAGELVETTRLWARTVAGIDAAMVEQVGAHLLTRQYSEPHWSARQARVVANERVSLLGVPIIANRTVGYAHVDPTAAREIFIRSALVEGDWRTRHHFVARNARTRAEAEELEERTRRRDLLVDDQAIFDFYDARLPADIVSGAHFDTWWRKKRHQDDGFLDLGLADLVAGERPDLTGFPDRWPVAGFELPVDYVFSPGAANDGVQVSIDLAQLNQVPAEPFGWQVPGLRAELATALIRGLPKRLRTRFVPAPDFARRALDEIGPEARDAEPFPVALGAALRQLTGELVPADAWAPGTVDDHLRVTFVIRDGDRELGRGKDLADLQRRFAPRLTATLTRAVARPGMRGATDWSFGELSDEQRVGGGVGYPGLVDAGDAVDLVLHESRAARDASHAAGLRRLVQLNTPDPTKWVIAHLSNTDKLALGNSPYPSVPALLADARLAAVGRLIEAAGGVRSTRDAAAFTRLCDTVRAELADTMRTVVGEAAEVLRRTQAARLAIATVGDAEVAADAGEQLDGLVHKGFLSGTPRPWVDRLGRYVAAIGVRLANRERNPRRDDELLGTIWPLEAEYAELLAEQPDGPLPAALAELGWKLEELRVGLFAQQLGTAEPVSVQRIRKALDAARR